MTETIRTILPRYIHIKALSSASYLSSTNPSITAESSRLAFIELDQSSEATQPQPSTLFEAIPVEDFDSSLPDILHRRAVVAASKAAPTPKANRESGTEEGAGGDNKAGEKDHSTQSKFENMYFLRHVQSGNVVLAQGTALILEKEAKEASICLLMRLTRNVFRIAILDEKGQLAYISGPGSQSDDSDHFASLSTTAGPFSKLLIEGGMFLRITDIRYHTEDANICILPPLVCSLPIPHRDNDTTNKALRLWIDLPRSKGIWRNKLGYGVGPQAVFDTGLPYILWVHGDDSRQGIDDTLRPVVEVSPVIKGAGRNAIYGEKDIGDSGAMGEGGTDVEGKISLRYLLKSRFGEDEVLRHTRVEILDISESDSSTEVSTKDWNDGEYHIP